MAVAATGSGTVVDPASGSARTGRVAASGTGSVDASVAGTGAATLPRVAASGTGPPRVFVDSSFEVDLVAFLTSALGMPVYATLYRGRKFRGPVNVGADDTIVTYTIIYEGRDQILSGTSGLVQAHCQIDIFAVLFDDVIPIAESIRKALGPLKGLMGSTEVKSCALKDRNDAWLENEDPQAVGRYRRINEFAIWFSESVPAPAPAA